MIDDAPPDRNRLAADILAMVKKHGGDEEKARHEFTMRPYFTISAVPDDGPHSMRKNKH
jgi:hypothetical protein